MSTKVASFVIALACLAQVNVAAPANAATGTSGFGVSVIVQAGCTVSAPAFVPGYTYALANAATVVGVSCTNIAPHTVSVTPGSDLVARPQASHPLVPALHLRSYQPSIVSPIASLIDSGDAITITIEY